MASSELVRSSVFRLHGRPTESEIAVNQMPRCTRCALRIERPQWRCSFHCKEKSNRGAAQEKRDKRSGCRSGASDDGSRNGSGGGGNDDLFFNMKENTCVYRQMLNQSA